MFQAHLSPDSDLDFQRILQRLADATDRPVEEVLRQQGRLLARDMAYHIHPRGLRAPVGRAYGDSVSRFLQSLYRPIGWIYTKVRNAHGEPAARGLVKLIHSRKFQEAETLLQTRLNPNLPVVRLEVGLFDGGDLHRRWRWRRRRRYPVRIVLDWSNVEAYAERVLTTIGYAKGALANAGKQLDGKTPGYTKWVLRHIDAPGTGRLLREKGGFYGFIESRVRYARSALPLHDEQHALDVRAQTAEKDLKRIVDAKIRRALRGS